MYIDDILVAGCSSEVINKIKKILSTNFDIESLGEIRSYLAIRVTRQKDYFLLDQ